MLTKKKYFVLFFVMAFVLAGCFGAGESLAAGLPHKADSLRVAFTSDPPSLGIYDHSSLIATVVNYLTYNGLMKVAFEKNASHTTVPEIRFSCSCMLIR